MATQQQQDFFTRLGRKPVIFVQGAGGITGIEVVKGIKARLGTSDQFTIVASVCKTDDNSTHQLQSMSGVEVLPFDLHDKELVNRIFGLNIQKLVVIPPFTADRVECVTSFTDRAYQAGIKQMVLLSVLGADSDANEFFRDMKLIQNKIRSYKEDFNWTILGSAIHMECFEGLTPKLKQGALTIPLLADKKIPPISSCDIGKFATKVLLDGGCERKICELTGPELLSGNDLAKIFTNTLGRNVAYTPVPPQEFRDVALQCKMEDVKIKSLQNLFDWYNSGQGNRTSNEYERVMGTKPTSFTAFVKDHLACFQ